MDVRTAHSWLGGGESLRRALPQAWRSGTVASVRRPIAVLLDLIITAYLLALALIILIGGVDLGVVSIHEPAKPLLVLAIAIPLRLTLRERLVWSDLKIRVPPCVADVGFAVLATRLATFAIGFLANVLFAPNRRRGFELPFESDKFAQIFVAWDSGWYFDIARRGYYFTETKQSSVAFFPLYPLTMRAMAWPFGGSEKAIWVAGIVVSCAAFVLALIAVHRLTERHFGDRDVARRAVIYMAVFPFSLFFTRVYAESLFLLTSVLAISRAYDGRWARAGLWGALATLARPNGILIGLPLALIAIHGRPDWRTLVRRWTTLLPVPAALLGYCVFVYTLSGDPLGWLNAQRNWGYTLGHPPWQQLQMMLARLVDHGLYDYFFLSNLEPFRLFHGVAALIFLAATPLVFARFGVALGAYVLVSLLVPLSSSALEGIGRYAAVLFPAFILLGTVRSPRLHEAIVIVASLFLALFVCLFVTVYPIY